MDSVIPTTSYLVCATPRSGSTLLCETLRATGVAGVPLEAGRPSGEPAAAWRGRVVRRGLTANGVWGGKLMWGHVEDLLSRARALDGLAAADLQTALRALLGDVRFVFVTR